MLKTDTVLAVMALIAHTLSTRYTVMITHTTIATKMASAMHAHTTDPFNFKQALLQTFAGVLTVQENLDLYDSSKELIE